MYVPTCFIRWVGQVGLVVGMSNGFWCPFRVASPLAMLYSTSVLEHHHFDHCIMILNSEVRKLPWLVDTRNCAKVVGRGRRWASGESSSINDIFWGVTGQQHFSVAVARGVQACHQNARARDPVHRPGYILQVSPFIPSTLPVVTIF